MFPHNTDQVLLCTSLAVIMSFVRLSSFPINRKELIKCKVSTYIYLEGRVGGRGFSFPYSYNADIY